MATYSGFTDPGSNTATALDTATYIGGSLLSTPSIFQDSLTTSSDTNDYYRFTLSSSSSSIVNLELDGLTSNADILLRDSGGGFLYASRNTGTADEKIRVSLSHAPNDVYFVQVFLNPGESSTSYNLRMSAEAIQNINISDNSTTEAATNNDLGTFNSTANIAPITNFVGSRGQIIDTNDYYKFTIASNTTGTVNVALNSLNGTDTLYGDLQLLNSSNTVIAQSNTLGTTSDSVSLSLGAGAYYIRAYSQADPGNYNLQFNFTADAPDQGGNTLGTSTPITLPTTISDVVSSADTSDYYKFTLASTALVDIKFTSLTADANITLQNQSGGNIQFTNLTGTTLDAIRRSLSAGTYNILINRGSSATAEYTLSVSAETINSDTSGNSLALAQNIGSLNGSVSRSEFVGNIDINDYYKFTLNSTSSLNLGLNILSNYSDVQLVNADVQLLNSNGLQVAISNQTGNTNESINTTLNAGTYYVRVYTTGLANTFYDLNLTAQPQAKLVQDINSGGSSNPANLTALGNFLYFTANDGINGEQLWRSDGNTTTSLSNISNFNPSQLAVFNNRIYFTASDSSFGRELWEYNGTSVNRISDINLNAGNSDPNNLTVVGNQLFFTSVDSSTTRKLWVYNGSSVNLVDVNPGFATTNTPTFTNAFNNRLFFTTQNNSQLWSTDGTIAGTQVITAGGFTNSTPRSLTVVGNTLYFTAKDSTSGQEVWQYQSGPTASLLKDITPGNNSYAPTNLTAVGNTLYFVTDSDNDFNFELWKSDGTAVGTDGQPPNLGLGAFFLTAVANNLYFVANDPATGLELWRTDGTSINTAVVKNISSGTADSLPTSLVNFNNTLAFAASDGTNREVWFSDGTALNTLKVSNINATGNANPDKLTVVGTKLFFTANGANGTELYVI